MGNNFFYNIYPSIDLHGYDQMSGIVMTNDFIMESIKLGNKKIVIIHGIGTGILKRAVHNSLKKNKNVLKYYMDGFNLGCTIAELDLGGGDH